MGDLGWSTPQSSSKCNHLRRSPYMSALSVEVNVIPSGKNTPHAGKDVNQCASVLQSASAFVLCWLWGSEGIRGMKAQHCFTFSVLGTISAQRTAPGCRPNAAQQRHPADKRHNTARWGWTLDSFLCLHWLTVVVSLHMSLHMWCHCVKLIFVFATLLV